MDDLKKILNFVQMTHDFRGVERDILLPKEKRLENDLEHSFQLVIFCWYISRVEKLTFDVDKMIKYALIHDLVEVYAGDTPLYSSDKNLIKTKKQREKEAAVKIEEKFPEFTELHQLIKKYEKKSDLESKFVYAADKLLPIISIYLNKGHAWKSHNISLQAIIDKNYSRISKDKKIKKYFIHLIDLLKENPEYLVQAYA